MSWIRVSDRRPTFEDGPEVWAYCGGVVEALEPPADEFSEFFYHPMFGHVRGVTHWQPIVPPLPPDD